MANAVTALHHHVCSNTQAGRQKLEWDSPLSAGAPLPTSSSRDSEKRYEKRTTRRTRKFRGSKERETEQLESGQIGCFLVCTYNYLLDPIC